MLHGIFQGTGPNLSGYQINVAYPATGRNGIEGFNQEFFGASALPYNSQVFPVQVYSRIDYKYFFINDIKSNCQDLYYEQVDNKRSNITVDLLSSINDKYGERLAIAIGITDRDMFKDWVFVSNLMRDFIAGYTEGKLHKRLTDAGIDLDELAVDATEVLNHDLFKVQNYGEKELFPKISFGVFAKDLLEKMESRIELDLNQINYSETDPKMFIHAHNRAVISSLLRYMEVNFKTKLYYPDNGSSLTFELKRPDGKSISSLTDQDYYVDIVFNDIPLKTIAFDQFREMLKETWSVRKIRWECSLNPFEYWGYQNSTIVLGVLLGAVFIATLIVLIVWKCGSKN